MRIELGKLADNDNEGGDEANGDTQEKKKRRALSFLMLLVVIFVSFFQRINISTLLKDLPCMYRKEDTFHFARLYFSLIIVQFLPRFYYFSTLVLSFLSEIF